MSYNTQAQLSRDPYLHQRIAACAASEGEEHPVAWADANQWHIAAAPGFDAAYSYAIDTQVEDPGRNDAVINDAMILAAVQTRRAAATGGE